MTSTRARVGGVVLLALLVMVVPVYALVLRNSEDPIPSPVAGEAVPPIRVAPLARLAVAGDTGTGDAAQAATVDVMLDQAQGQAPYDALVLLGDLVYEDGDVDEVDTAVIEPFAPLTGQGTELVPVLGNHDYRSGEQAEILPAWAGRSRGTSSRSGRSGSSPWIPSTPTTPRNDAGSSRFSRCPHHRAPGRSP